MPASASWPKSVSKKLGQPVVVENKAGASGVLGAMALQDAKPDGYTISPDAHERAAPAAAQHGADLRSDQRPHLHPADHRLRHGRGGAHRRAVEDAARAAGLRQGQSRQAELGHAGHRLDPAPRHGACRHGAGASAGRTRPIAAPPTRCAPCWAARSTSPRSPRAGRRWSWPASCGCWPSSPAQRAKRFPDVPTVRELGIDIVVDSPGGLIGPQGHGSRRGERSWPTPSAPPRRSPSIWSSSTTWTSR